MTSPAPSRLIAAILFLGGLDAAANASSIARTWNEENLAAIRLSFPDPPVHARNIWHVSVAMWDAWAAYDSVAVGYLHREPAAVPGGSDLATARHEAISYAAYRVLSHRYSTRKHPNTPDANAATAQANFDNQMADLGYSTANTSTIGPSPSAVGNRVAETIINFTAGDQSNEVLGYTDSTYTPVNPPLILENPNAPNALVDVNRWQPLEFVEAFSQTGIPLDFTIQVFVGSHWGEVWPFALSRAPGQTVYFDPGAPPILGGATDTDFKNGVVEVIQYSSLLDPSTAPMVDRSPGTAGFNNPLGTSGGTGHTQNPVTMTAYAPNMVNEADFGRVVAEFWADGPESETPPGHWNVIANEVSDTPGFERRFMGQDPELDPLEWDVKMYFLLNAAVHDAAVAAWGCKREYDYIRPISCIRHMARQGQSSNPGDPHYNPQGLPIVPGLIEVATATSVLVGQPHQNLGSPAIGKVVIKAWQGAPLDPATQFGGVGWILAEDWAPYQLDTFVTPAFAGYISGHSTFSRAAAEVLTRFTGSAFFPGGLGTHDVPAGDLAFELGPSAPVQLQWGTFYDAADQAGLSRLYGGIHVPADDGPGRVVGAKCGIGAWELGIKYFDGSILNQRPEVNLTTLPDGNVKVEWTQYRGLFYKLHSSPDLTNGNFTGEFPLYRASSDRASHPLGGPAPLPRNEFFRIEQSPFPEPAAP
ncbi:MAG: vanadium-dependent haloperoxidase [Verrucomicrobiota bacterium]